MTTETITLKKTATLATFLNELLKSKHWSFVQVEGFPTLKVDFVSEKDLTEEQWRDTYTKEDHEARLQAQKNLKNGEVVEIDDMSAITADEFSTLIANFNKKYEV